MLQLAIILTNSVSLIQRSSDADDCKSATDAENSDEENAKEQTSEVDDSSKRKLPPSPELFSMPEPDPDEQDPSDLPVVPYPSGGVPLVPYPSSSKNVDDE